MRTTITLDPDVDVLVHKRMDERGVSFKEAINAALREALSPKTTRRRSLTASTPMGEPRLPLENALRVAGELEDEAILQKLRIGK